MSCTTVLQIIIFIVGLCIATIFAKKEDGVLMEKTGSTIIITMIIVFFLPYFYS